jgi:hypothetical protein
LKDDIEVEEVSEMDELAEEGQLDVIIVMNINISLKIVLFRDDLGVPIVDNTHATEDFPELITKWEDCARK